MNFDNLFSPTSIAVIGASRDEKSVGYAIFSNLLNGSFQNPVYPVNPNATELLGRRCFFAVSDIPTDIGQAIIAVPSSIVLKVSEEAIAKGATSLVVISAGFKEAGEDGKRKEEELCNLCKKHGVTLIGPNCLGVLNAHVGMNASFETVLPKKGNIAFLSQSGALVSSLIDIATARGVGFSKIVSLGNKALVSEETLLPYLLEDRETAVIALYAESMSNARAWITIMNENYKKEAPKPVVLLKAGVSQEGKQASSSHTGALAGSEAAYDALCKQAGILRVRTVDELITVSQVFSQNPPAKGNKLAIITNAGGPGIISTDEASHKGLVLSAFTSETKEKLSAILPKASHITNPVDVLGDATSVRYSAVLTAVGSDPGVDMVLGIVTPQSMTDIVQTAASFVEFRNSFEKPVIATFMGDPFVEDGVSILSATNVSHVQFPESGVKALSFVAQFSHIKRKPHLLDASKKEENKKAKEYIEQVKKTTMLKNIPTPSVFSLLELYDIPVVAHALTQSSDEAQKKAVSLGADFFALKIVSPDISHKTDAGGVLLSVKKEDVARSFSFLLETVSKKAPHAKTHGVLLTPMVEKPAIEMIVGIKKEKEMGTLIMVGFGGIYVEILKDTSFRYVPVSDEDVHEMISELKTKALLEGVRGGLASDINALKDVVKKLSHLAQDNPQIEEIEINPLFVFAKEEGAVAVDSRMAISST